MQIRFRNVPLKTSRIIVFVVILILLGVSFYQQCQVFRIFFDETLGNEPPKPTKTTNIGNEPFVDRLQRRFAPTRLRNKSPYIFFKHIRKAGGTSIRHYLFRVLEFHQSARKSGVFFDSLDEGRFQFYRGKFERDVKIYFHRRDESKITVGSKTQITGVSYIEQEFQPMDWRCPLLDPRWNDSIRVTALRHPVERAMSEFFYSGLGKGYPINRSQLYSNESYTRELTEFLSDNVPKWIKTDMIKAQLSGRYLFRYYLANFQVRAFAGCSAASCLDWTTMQDWTKKQWQRVFMESSDNYNSTLCSHFDSGHHDSLFKPCLLAQPECPRGCEGPCLYPANSSGTMNEKKLHHAKEVLESFDIVLLTEQLEDEEVSEFLSDVMSVPHYVDLVLQGKKTNKMKMIDQRERSHFYRDLLANLTTQVSDILHKQNELDIELFNHAVILNGMMLEKWRKERLQMTQLI